MTTTIKQRSINEYDETYSQTLKIAYYYHLGGMNYFTGTNEARGYYASVLPVKISKGEGYTSESFTAFTGTKQLIEPSARYNEKILLTIKDKTKDILPTLIKHVVTSNKLTLKPVNNESN